MELNRVLRPGGYFVWSATPVYQTLEEDVQIWKGRILKFSFFFGGWGVGVVERVGFYNKLTCYSLSEMSALTKSMCWELVTIKKDKLNSVGVAIYHKAVSNECYDQRKQNRPPMCKSDDDPNAAW